MTARTVALAIGIVFVFIGLLGFFPGVVSVPTADAPTLAADTGYGYLFGLFPVNVLLNVLHIVIGIWAVNASRTLSQSMSIARGLAILFGVLAVMGTLPWTATAFGLVPLFEANVWLYALTAAAAAYAGYSRAIDAVPAELAAGRAS